MPPTSLRCQHLERHRATAARAFENHRITKESDRRWLLQRLRDSGCPDWTYAAEVIVLEGGALYVGGDIAHVVFAHGPRDPVARVRWMGECNDLDYYVRQKAVIGTGLESVSVWDVDVACDELRAWVAENPEDVRDREAIDEALETDDRNSFYEHAHRGIGRQSEPWEVVADMGEVLSTRVIYAHAALARLCVLLRQQAQKRTAEGGSSVEGA